MDRERFQTACDTVMNSAYERKGIGTLSEKMLHAVLKNYFEPNPDFQEIKVGSYYADICNEKGIVEVQTKQFQRLRKKLEVFLPAYPVTIVYPIAYQKWLRWIDEETGEITKGRRSPKKGTSFDVFPELYKIKEYMIHENFNLHILLIDMEEYRFLNGWSKDRKKGSVCSERIPLSLQEEVVINHHREYKRMIPQALKESFTSKEFAKEAHISLTKAQTVLNVLFDMHVVKRIGKQGRLYLYERSE